MIDAVLTTSLTVVRLDARAEAIQEFVSTDAKALIEQLSRVVNISKKGEAGDVDPSLFENDYEIALHEAIEQIAPATADAVEMGDYKKALDLLQQLESPIMKYFEHTMVMSDDEAVRQNRLHEMNRLATTIKRVADFNALVL